MNLKCVLTKSEAKELHVQFGATRTSCIGCVDLRMHVVIFSLFSHKLIRIKWDRSEKGMRTVDNLTKNIGLGGHVIGMIDELKLEFQEPSDSLEQNRDCNGWRSTASQNLVLV